MNASQVVGSYFEALAKGEVEKAFSLFDPQAKWSQPGSNQFSGVKSGPEEIGKMIGAMMEYCAGSLAVKPTGSLMENDGLVAVPVRFSASKGSKSMDMSGVDLVEVKDGKITHVWLFSEDQQAEDDFWGK